MSDEILQEVRLEVDQSATALRKDVSETWRCVKLTMFPPGFPVGVHRVFHRVFHWIFPLVFSIGLDEFTSFHAPLTSLVLYASVNIPIHHLFLPFLTRFGLWSGLARVVLDSHGST